MTERRPFVTVKMALDADGGVPRGEQGIPRWVTGPAARAHGHLLRAKSDAILVGSRTVRDDNPKLTCRLPGLGDRSPVRVVLSRSLDIPLDCKVMKMAGCVPVWLVCGRDADADRRNAFAALGAEIIEVAQVAGRLWLPAVLEALVARGITRLLVEGGPSIWRAFAGASLVDDVAMFMTGGGAKRTSEDDARGVAARWLGPLPLTLREHDDLEPDRLWRFRRAFATEGR